MKSLLPFYDIYGALLAWVYEGDEETNVRTKARIRAGRGGTSFRVDLSDGLLPTIGFRKTFPKSAAAETAWYLQGTRDVTFIRQYAPLWDKFVESDGKTVESAYGYRWRRHFGRDQIAQAIMALATDTSDRRIYISAWDPGLDGLGSIGQRNVPCPVGFSLSRQGGQLHSSMMLRSSDIFVGLPYDVMGHALLMDAIAHELRIRPGVMHVTLAHAHLYEHHWDMTREALQQDPVVPRLQLPGWSVSQIVRAPDDYVVRYGDDAKSVTWPSFNPRPHVVE